MGKARKTITRTGSITDAVSAAFGELTMLGDEIREWHDNLDGKFPDKCERLDEAANILEALQEPDVPEAFNTREITWVELLPRKKNRPLSRADRLSNACIILDAAIESLENYLEGVDLPDADEAEGLRDELDTLSVALGCVEFPGFYS